MSIIWLYRGIRFLPAFGKAPDETEERMFGRTSSHGVYNPRYHNNGCKGSLVSITAKVQ